MRVRKVDKNGDMVFGGDQAAYLRNVPEAVGQVVESRLNLWEGQWYLDLQEGTPYEQQVLGKRTEGLRDPTIQARILDTPGVAELVAYDSTLDRYPRAFTVNAQIDTIYSSDYPVSGIQSQTSLTIKVEQGR